jgi:cell division protein FtsQ
MADQVLSWSRPAAARSRRSNRGLVAAALIAGLALAGEGIFHFLVAPNLRIEHINITSDTQLPRAGVLSRAGLEDSVYFFAIDPNQVRLALEAWPLVKAATVEMVFPDTLRVHIQTRQPVALALAEGTDGLRPFSIDERGVVYAEGASAAVPTLPVLSGIRFEGQVIGARLPAQLLDFLGALGELGKLEPALVNYFSEFQIRSREAGGFDLVGYPMAQRVPVRFAADLDQETLRMAIMVLDVMRKEHILERISELDFRSGDVVYRLKEE